MTPNPQDSAVALEVERAIREALDAGPTPCEWSAMVKPSASYSDHGWRAVAMCGAKWMVGAPSRVMLADGGWNNEANAALMAACNPDAMRSLLAEIDRLRASQSDGTSGGWQAIETAPEGVLLVVGWLDAEDEAHPERHDFDYLEDGVWQKHTENVEYFQACAPAGSRGPKEQAPYTHWMPLPAAPTQGENHVG